MKSFRHALLIPSIICLCLTAAALSLTSCNNGSPSVEGEIAGADHKLITLEKSDYAGQWMVIDSTRTSHSGKFNFDIPQQQAPEVFRLGMDGRYVYFPVDSTETVNFRSKASAFDTEFALEGSDDARNMALFEKELISLPANASKQQIEDFKRSVYTKYMQSSRGSVVAYYILTKTINGNALYDPSEPSDQRYWAAVATSFSQYSPDDPRTRLLEQTAIRSIRKRNANRGLKRVVRAPQMSIIDINLTDEDNRNVSLSDIVGNGKPTLLIFSLMNQPESPEINRGLHRLMQTTGKRYNFYHVCFDTDMFAWREAARNLPWTTVIDPTGRESAVLVSYNVRTLPDFYIINSSGELVEHATSLEEAGKIMAKF